VNKTPWPSGRDVLSTDLSTLLKRRGDLVALCPRCHYYPHGD